VNWRIFLGISFSLISSVASADEIKLGRASMDNTFVWRSEEDYSEAIKLIAAGVHQKHPELVTRLMACMVKPGTKGVVLKTHLGSAQVLVTDGPHSGCRGVIAIEDAKGL
jgi:hypothetical protein